LSTILKALRRIEEEKADGFERPLREDVVLAPTARRRVNPSSLIAVAAVAFAATVALLTLVHDREAARSRAAATAAASPAPRTVAVAAAPPAERPAPRTAPAAAEPAPAPSPAPVAPSAATADSEVVLLNPDARGRSPIAVVSESPAPVAPPIAERPPPKRAVAPPPGAPSLRVLRTSWHPRSEKRVAWVQATGSGAPQAVHEGDRIDRWLVREIEPAAVVLSDGAEEIRRRVGSP